MKGTMQEQKKRKIGWILIPPYIAGRSDLLDSEKLLYGKIQGLISNEGYCFASNEYLAENVSKSAGRVSKIVSSLEKKGLVKTVVRKSRKENGTMVSDRRIYVTGSREAAGIKEDTLTGHIEPPLVADDQYKGAGVTTASHARPSVSLDTASRTRPVEDRDIRVESVGEFSKTTGEQSQPVVVNGVRVFPNPILSLPFSRAPLAPPLPSWEEKSIDELRAIPPEEIEAIKHERYEGGLSKTKLYPCTREEMYELSVKKSVRYEELLDVYWAVIEAINSGDIPKKWKSKTVYNTVSRWCDLAIKRGDVSVANNEADLEIIKLATAVDARWTKLKLLAKKIKSE